jgi:hypothetical protein
MNGHLRQLHLRHAAGYVELGELLVDGDAPVPAAACKLFTRALEELRALPESSRHGPVASLLEGRALRNLGAWQEAIPPLRRAAEAAPDQLETWLGLGWRRHRGSPCCSTIWPATTPSPATWRRRWSTSRGRSRSTTASVT